MYFGRTFELPDGRIIESCEYCGNPCFEPDKHTCPGLMADLLARAEDEA